jgi:hypothetical protein
LAIEDHRSPVHRVFIAVHDRALSDEYDCPIPHAQILNDHLPSINAAAKDISASERIRESARNPEIHNCVAGIGLTAWRRNQLRAAVKVLCLRLKANARKDRSDNNGYSSH